MGRTDEASAVARATPHELYEALSDPEARESWLPPQNMTGVIEAFDLRVGGGYLMTLTYDDPSGAPGKFAADRDVTRVTFVDVVPDERIVESVEFVADDPAFAGSMTMTWGLKPVAEGTEVTITARDVPPGISQADHEIGLRSSLDQLIAYVSS